MKTPFDTVLRIRRREIDQTRIAIHAETTRLLEIDQESRALEQATENTRKLERELRETKADAKGMLSVIELNEKQLGFYATREENQKKMAIEARSANASDADASMVTSGGFASTRAERARPQDPAPSR